MVNFKLECDSCYNCPHGYICNFLFFLMLFPFICPALVGCYFVTGFCTTQLILRVCLTILMILVFGVIPMSYAVEK